MEKNPAKRIVHLRVYKGTKMSFNADGSIQNTNQRITTEHNTNEWRALMSTVSYSGFFKVEVEGVNYLDNDFTECKDFEDIKEEVRIAFIGVENKVEQTPEQKKIAELEAKLEALINAGAKKESIKNDSKEETNPALSAARAEYFKVFGKRGGPSWTVEEINAKIAEKQAETAE